MDLEDSTVTDNLEQENVHWLCVRAQPRRERIAAQHLMAIPGIHVLFPQARYQRKSPKGVRWIQEPLFPSYLFVLHPANISSRAITYAMGVSHIVRRGQDLAVVPHQVIDEIRSLCHDDVLEIPAAPLNVGDQVKIIGGIFSGSEANIVALAPAKERVRILLEILGRETEVDVPVDLVDRPTPHPLSSR